MLTIFNEDKYSEFKKSGKKPSIFCKENLKMSSVKSYEFVKDYFENPEVLVRAIKKYNELSKIRKDEYTLQTSIRRWGNSQGIRISKDVMTFITEENDKKYLII